MSMKEIDANSGIAPEQWVKDLQSQVTLAYDTIDGEYELIIHFIHWQKCGICYAVL